MTRVVQDLFPYWVKHAAWGVLPKSTGCFKMLHKPVVDIFIAACRRFLERNGTGLLSLKAASERCIER